MGKRKTAFAIATALVGTAALIGAQGWDDAVAKAPAAPARVAAKPAMQSQIQIYLLAGQSNMVGYGMEGDLTPAEKTANPVIKVFGNDWVQRNALDPLDINTGQLDRVSNECPPPPLQTGEVCAPMRVGPGLFFARNMVANGAVGIVLIPCAKGGSSMDKWVTTSLSRDSLYGSCIQRARQYYGNYPISGVLWYQGEADTQNYDEVSNWPRKFRTLVDAFRRDLNRPNLPVVMVGLADKATDPTTAENFPWWTAMQSNQANINYPCTAHVSAKGLPLRPDQVHLTTDGQRMLGPKLAVAMRTLRQTCT
jgi:hypothetical protein